MNSKFMRKIALWLTDERFWLAAFLLLVVWPVMLQYFNGGFFNNFLIYGGATENFFAETPLYLTYTDRYADINHYGPLFAFIFYPFTLLPLLPALLLWLAGSALLLWYAIKTLPLPSKTRAIVMLFAAIELYNAAAYQQFGIVTTALIVLTFSMIIRQKEGAAALCIVIGTLVKVYGIVGLAFFFFIEPRRMWRFVGYMALWSVVLVGIQFLAVSADYLVKQYGDWVREISVKDLQNRFAVYQNRGLLGMVRKVSGSIYYSDLLLMLGGMVLFLLPYLRFKQFSARGFQLSVLASVSLFLVLFSSGTETCSYLSAVLGVGLWVVSRPLPKLGVWGWFVVVFVVFGSLANAILPPSAYHGWFFPYALKALPFTVAWLTLMFEMLTLDYRVDKKLID